MDEAISKKQYTLKLKPIYFLATKFNLATLLFCYFLCETQTFLMLYPILAFLLYRFVFKENKLSNPYSIFLFQKWSSFYKIVRRRK
ncbi:hypothetical protein [Helicobacter ganmani]|uniref:hypothetical protein n=1 Tax=Helicobacter ganmani TaxID=60246 RepID=UPI003A8792A9